MRWIADWCFVRGVNLLLPHAFYYSIRGPRLDERPPDVGPNSAWWHDYSAFALYCRRLCWLNTDSEHLCHLAILGEAGYLPWQAAKVCFEHQRDFNYVEMRDLWEQATIDEEGLHLAGMTYKALIIDGLKAIPPEAIAPLQRLSETGRVVAWQTPIAAEIAAPPPLTTESELVAAIDGLISPLPLLEPHHPDLRLRRVRKRGVEYYLLFNEGARDISFTLETVTAGQHILVDPFTGQQHQVGDGCITLQARQTAVLL